MELIIGRDGATAKLKVVDGTEVKLYGEAASVPVDVSRQHCQLTAVDDNTFIIRNIKAANVTWVNGIEVQTKRITREDKVQLGQSRYLLPLDEILEQESCGESDCTGDHENCQHGHEHHHHHHHD